MIVGNVYQEVDTAHATQVGVSAWKSSRNWLVTTEKQLSAWKSERSERFFVLLETVESLLGFERSRETLLFAVYKTVDDLLMGARVYEIRLTDEFRNTVIDQV